jgi:hypothetical protein
MLSGGAPAAVPAAGGGVSKRAAQREAQYWARLSNVLDEPHWRMYGALEKQLDK